jgi:hypothetical protein
MNQRNLSRWLKTIVWGTGVCGAILYLFIFPSLGKGIILDYPDFSFCYWPWLILIWVTAIPCYAALIFAWCIANEIGKDNSFSEKNAALLKKIAHLAIFNSAVFFVGNVALFFLGMNHPGILVCSLFVVFAGIAIAVAAASLSHLVQKAAELRNENDLTI